MPMTGSQRPDIAETGLFFTGANGYRLKEIITVKELIHKLMEGEDAEVKK